MEVNCEVNCFLYLCIVYIYQSTQGKPYQEAIDEIRQLAKLRCPLDKLECLGKNSESLILFRELMSLFVGPWSNGCKRWI